jgi:hypothetical protein
LLIQRASLSASLTATKGRCRTAQHPNSARHHPVALLLCAIRVSHFPFTKKVARMKWTMTVFGLARRKQALPARPTLGTAAMDGRELRCAQPGHDDL